MRTRQLRDPVAALDSGAAMSFFDGEIAQGNGLKPHNARDRKMRTHTQKNTY